MRKTLVVSLFLLTSLSVWAAPPAPTISECSASAVGDVRRPVIVDVVVENRGKEPSAPGNVELTLKPQVRGGQQKAAGGNSIWDPYVMNQQVPSLPPGQKQTLHFSTQFESKNTIKGQRGSFRASNIDPTGSDVGVDMKAVIK